MSAPVINHDALQISLRNISDGEDFVFLRNLRNFLREKTSGTRRCVTETTAIGDVGSGRFPYPGIDLLFN